MSRDSEVTEVGRVGGCSTSEEDFGLLRGVEGGVGGSSGVFSGPVGSFGCRVGVGTRNGLGSFGISDTGAGGRVF